MQSASVAKALLVRECDAGHLLCRTSLQPTHWIGVVDGLLKMSKDNADGTSVTYAGLPPGGWFSEGPLIKNCARTQGDNVARSQRGKSFVIHRLETSAGDSRHRVLEANH